MQIPVAGKKYWVESNASRVEFFIVGKRMNQQPETAKPLPILQLLNSCNS